VIFITARDHKVLNVLQPPLPKGIPVYLYNLLPEYWVETLPFLLGISDDLSWGGYGFSL